MSFYVCSSCGYQENNHNFRHQFKGKYKIYKKVDDKNRERFVFDLSCAPEIMEEGHCQVPQCKMTETMHIDFLKRFGDELNKNGKITHDFVGVNKYHRKFSFVLPDDTKCRTCNVQLKDHKDIKVSENHIFTTKLVLKNKEKCRADIPHMISIISDDGQKIKFNS